MSGLYPAGVGPAGFDPVSPLSPPAATGAPIAVLVDARTRNLVVDARGIFVATHPVDQRVVLAVIIAKGTLRSAPDAGSGLREIQYRGAALLADVRATLRAALSTMVKAGDLEILAIDVETIESGFVVSITYRNLRLQPAAPQTLRV